MIQRYKLGGIDDVNIATTAFIKRLKNAKYNEAKGVVMGSVMGDVGWPITVTYDAKSNEIRCDEDTHDEVESKLLRMYRTEVICQQADQLGVTYEETMDEDGVYFVDVDFPVEVSFG